MDNPKQEKTDNTGRHALVLVVDDFADTRALTAEMLSHAGFRVEQAENGCDALEKAAKLAPDVILLDLSLPDIDGWKVTQRLRDDERTRGCAVIAYTAHALDEFLDRARAAGCKAVLTKPCSMDELIRTVRSLVPGTAPVGDS